MSKGTKDLISKLENYDCLKIYEQDFWNKIFLDQYL